MEQAIEALRRCLQINPRAADVWHELAMAYSDVGNIEQATQSYKKAIEVNPDFGHAWNNLGVLYEDHGKPDEAVKALKEAARISPQSPEAANNLGVALASRQDFEEAIDWYRRSLELSPNYAAAFNNLGNALRSLGRSDEAISALRNALRLKPDYAEAYNNLAIALVQAGRHEEAMHYYDQAVYYRPDYPEAHMNRSLDRLALGEFAEGWIEYEWRWRGSQLRPRLFNRPRWDGSSPAGKRVLVHFEQGLGDTLQFIRFAKLLQNLGATVVAEVQKPLVKFLTECSSVDEVVATGGDLPNVDLQAPLLSLPGLFQTTLETIPADVPYVNPKPELIEKWRKRLADLDGFKVAIAWQGNPEYRGDRHRSIPLRHFAALSRIPGVTLISVQKGHGTE